MHNKDPVNWEENSELGVVRLHNFNPGPKKRELGGSISFSTIKKIIYIFMLTVEYFPRLLYVMLTYLNVSLQLAVGVEVMLTNQLCRFFYFF